MLETERKQLLPYAIIASLFFISTLIIILSVDPFSAGVLVLTSFYLSLFLFLSGFFGLIFYLVRINSIQTLPYEKHRAALRESILLAVLITGSLLLSSKQVLFWWGETFFVITVVLVETFFLI